MTEHSSSIVAVSNPALPPQVIFTVDVEDWYHILDVPSTPRMEDWAQLPSRVEANLRRLLDLFSDKGAHVTCFFLGWVAERYPHLVKECVRRGHEIASHGWAHRLVYEMSREEFQEDARKSREVLEDLAGTSVRGYRASGFSVTEQTPWFFEELARAGYGYDSSVFPAARSHGGMANGKRAPYQIALNGKHLVEVPVSVADLAGKPMCFFGGGYLRLFPYSLIRKKARQVLDAGRPVVFYIHPREIDPDHPRLPMSRSRRFKSYVNLHQTETKIRRILEEFPVTTFREFLSSHAKQPATSLDVQEFPALCDGWPQANA